MVSSFRKVCRFRITGFPVRRRHVRQKGSIPECNLTGRGPTIALLPVRSHSGINTICLLHFLFSKLCVHKQCSQCPCRDPGDTTSKVSSCVEPSQCFKNSHFDAQTKVDFTQRFDSYTFTNKAKVAFWRELHFN